MSHTAECDIKFTATDAVMAACREMGLPEPKPGKFSLHQAGAHEGIGVYLPGWRHPVIIDTKTGVAKYDNYNGQWGQAKHLEQLTQLYGVHVATKAAQRQGQAVRRVVQANGTIRLHLTGGRF